MKVIKTGENEFSLTGLTLGKLLAIRRCTKSISGTLPNEIAKTIEDDLVERNIIAEEERNL